MKKMTKRQIIMGCFIAIYLTVLVAVILFKFPFVGPELKDLRGVELVPFFVDGIKSGTFFFVNILFNILLFVPLGVFICLLKPNWKFVRKVVPIILLSLLFEILQYIFALGISDITDLITNTTGGILGICCCYLVKNRMDSQIKLGKNVIIALSTVADGDIRNAGKVGKALRQVNKNRESFLAKNGFDIDQAVLVRLDYDKDNFAQYKTVDKSWAGRGMFDAETVDVADALATAEKNLGLFLPLADCLGVVIYDTKNEVLMVSHLGRHNTEQFGAKKSIEYLQKNFGSDPADILIWLSPSAGEENYPLFAFENRSLREVNVEQFIKAGIKSENITDDNTGTTTDDRYYSYSNDQTDQRFAIVAKMV